MLSIFAHRMVCHAESLLFIRKEVVIKNEKREVLSSLKTSDKAEGANEKDSTRRKVLVTGASEGGKRYEGSVNEGEVVVSEKQKSSVSESKKTISERKKG